MSGIILRITDIQINIEAGYIQANKTSSYDESNTESLCNIYCSLGQGVVNPI